MSGVINDILLDVDDILGIRDDLGAALKKVYFVIRTWSGEELGAGAVTEVKQQMLPSPRVVEFTDQYRIREGGAVQQGDIMLKMVSKNKYPTKSDVDGSQQAANVEKLYEIGGKLYGVIAVTEKHLTWNVLLRPKSGKRS